MDSNLPQADECLVSFIMKCYQRYNRFKKTRTLNAVFRNHVDVLHNCFVLKRLQDSHMVIYAIQGLVIRYSILAASPLFLRETNDENSENFLDLTSDESRHLSNQIALLITLQNGVDLDEHVACLDQWFSDNFQKSFLGALFHEIGHDAESKLLYGKERSLGIAHSTFVHLLRQSMIIELLPDDIVVNTSQGKRKRL